MFPANLLLESRISPLSTLLRTQLETEDEAKLKTPTHIIDSALKYYNIHTM